MLLLATKGVFFYRFQPLVFGGGLTVFFVVDFCALTDNMIICHQFIPKQYKKKHAGLQEETCQPKKWMISRQYCDL